MPPGYDAMLGWTMAKRPQSPAEEALNSATHGLGALLSVAFLAVLVTFAALRGSARHVVACALFGATLVLLYLLSALYHGLRNPRVKPLFRVLDHAGIYLLIAGTYTPFCLIGLRGGWGWSLVGTIWGLALLGIAFKALLGFRYEIISALFYLVMGWLVILALGPLVRALPRPALLWLLGGGVAYTTGLAFYALDSRLRFGHAVWHLFVLAGSACHAVAVIGWLIPR